MHSQNLCTLFKNNLFDNFHFTDQYEVMVKRIIRTVIIEGTSLYLASQVASGFLFAKGAQSFIMTVLALAVASFVVKPIITLLILPINLLTFNFFRWASHGITLFLVDFALEEFTISNFSFPGFHSDYIDIPPLVLEQGVAAYLGFSVVISIIATVIYWIMEK